MYYSTDCREKQGVKFGVRNVGGSELTADRKSVEATIRKRREHTGAIEKQGVATGRARGRTRPQVAIVTCSVQ